MKDESLLGRSDTSDSLAEARSKNWRGQRLSIDRDAPLALWLEHTTRNSSGRRDALRRGWWSLL